MAFISFGQLWAATLPAASARTTVSARRFMVSPLVLDVAGLRERLRRPAPARAVYGDDGAGREEAGRIVEHRRAGGLVPIIAPAGMLINLCRQLCADSSAPPAG